VEIHELDPGVAQEISDSIAAVSASAREWYGKPLNGTVADLDLLQRMLSEGRIRVDDKRGLWNLGLVLGSVLSRSQGWDWALCEEDGIFDPVLVVSGSTKGGEAGLLFPMTMISHRVEDGGSVDVRVLYEATITQMREGGARRKRFGGLLG